MQLRSLGRSGLKIAPLMIGANVFGWTADRAATFKVLDAFVDAGVGGIDTANVYSRFVPGNVGGESETLIGAWLKASGKRNKVVIATKAGMDMGGDNKGLSRRYLMQAVDESLARLGIEQIDLYQAHRDDEDVPQEETLGAFAEMIKQGKVRAIGCSNFSAARLQSALAISAKNNWPRYETVQPEYNLMAREKFEGALQDLCVREEIGAIVFYSLASGFLSGKYRTATDLVGRARGGSVEQYMNPHGMAVLAALDEVAEQLSATPAQVALAWVMAKPGIAAPIASATYENQVKDLVGALNLKLSAAQLAALDAV
jgi:aryl-alcohol dehydrogenase-like predicted oxidoreductase